eukprot:CAMPEP_0197046594 /NCGR_PEP_ID=MMETSP1384-20130603/22296_1 /TAXON_ID=29189 /ORGANISM="Ammonia sp." /LENGTH=99 /DNA_ID=CAMNT_0042478419 /DNA_START=68 /DNA_END=364 /DNA_ORIENTATION=+
MAGYLYTISTCSSATFYKESTKYLVAMIVTDLLIDGCMLIVFTTKLQQLIYDGIINQSLKVDLSSILTSDLDAQQTRMIDVCVKQGILGLVIISFNSLF